MDNNGNELCIWYNDQLIPLCPYSHKLQFVLLCSIEFPRHIRSDLCVVPHKPSDILSAHPLSLARTLFVRVAIRPVVRCHGTILVYLAVQRKQTGCSYNGACFAREDQRALDARLLGESSEIGEGILER